ncbi:AaceriAGL211Cp [[Ashbya] aceris (nom. inval.)]|nr:AaceriAGL211Cp [[Ashbya] aceris (nom. inval.)]
MTDNVKQQDLYVYELLPELLSSLELIVFDEYVSEVTDAAQPEQNASGRDASSGKEDTKRCTACDVQVDSAASVREHYKSDFHKYNLKRKLNQLAPVSLEEFDRLTENDDIESISGSEDESEDDETLGTGSALRRTRLDVVMEEELGKISSSVDGNTSQPTHLNTRSPLIYFNSSYLPEGSVFGVHKCLFSPAGTEDPLGSMREWQKANQAERVSALFMMGGGHFAGAVVSHRRTDISGNAKKHGQSLQEQAVHFLEHKTFHRYTTRRKQGGSQSVMDNAKGKANSAGSTLRRYNEAALRNDVQELLRKWSPYLERCENIFIRAKNVADRSIFFGENSPLAKTDTRIRTFPFTTRRPTTSELRRAWCEITYLKKTLKPKPITVERQGPPKVTNESNSNKATEVRELSPAAIHTQELVSFLRKSKAPQLIAYIKKHNLSPNLILEPSDEYLQTPTLLHYASHNGLKNMVLILLSNLKCDPTLKNHMGRTAWDLTKRRDVKQAFQIARHNLGESFANWEDSHIDVPLSREQVAEINTREAEAANKEREKAVEEELKDVRERQKKALEAKRGPGKILVPQLSANERNLNSLTEEQRRRLMREQRARAAEARMGLGK